MKKNWYRPFFIMWTGQAFSLFGSSIVGFAIRWWLSDSTGSATLLSTLMSLHLLPHIVLNPLVGPLIDRWSRKRVMIVSDILIASVTVAMALLHRIEAVEVWHVYLFTIIASVCAVFHRAAMMASTALMVPKIHLTRVAGMNETVSALMNIVSRPLGALLVITLPMHSVFTIDVATACAAVAPLFFIHVPQPDHGADFERRKKYLKNLAEGFSFVWKWREFFRLLVSTVLFRFFVFPGFLLFPIAVTNHYRAGAAFLGWVTAAATGGMFGGGLLLSAWGGGKRKIYTTLGAMAGMSICSVLFGFLPESARASAIVVAFFIGFFNAMYHGPVTAIIQIHVPAEMHGRILTLRTSSIHIATPLGLIVAGFVAERFGIPAMYIFGGAAAFLVTVLAILNRGLRAIEAAPPEGNAAHAVDNDP